jgi:hypothetical protein
MVHRERQQLTKACDVLRETGIPEVLTDGS